LTISQLSEAIHLAVTPSRIEPAAKCRTTWTKSRPSFAIPHERQRYPIPRRPSATRSSLNIDERQTVEIIEALGFGTIESLAIRDGVPSYDAPPRILQSIKLDSDRDIAARKKAGLQDLEAMRISGHLTRNVFDRDHIIDEDDLAAGKRLEEYSQKRKQEWAVKLRLVK
jgi:hypothetical protein